MNDEQLADEWMRGKTMPTLALMEGQTIERVYDRLVQAGVTPKTLGRRSDLISERLEHHREQIAAAMTILDEAQGELDQVVVKAKRDGVSWQQLSALTNKSESYLIQHYAKRARDRDTRS